MATAIDISLNDATPVAQVYNPVGRQSNGDFRFTDHTPISAITSANGWNHLTLGISPPTSSKKHARVKTSCSFVNPAYDPEGVGEDSMMSILRTNTDTIIPDNFTAGARDNSYETFVSWVQSAEFKAAWVDLTGVFG